MRKKGLLSALLRDKKQDACCGQERVAKQEAKADCTCSDGCSDDVSIKILGSGCRNCVTLADNTSQALKQLGMRAKVEKVTDFAKITGYGVMSTPALVVNEKVVSYGKVLRPDEIANILKENR